MRLHQHFTAIDAFDTAGGAAVAAAGWQVWRKSNRGTAGLALFPPFTPTLFFLLLRGTAAGSLTLGVVTALLLHREGFPLL
jgi:hypothetical protein